LNQAVTKPDRLENPRLFGEGCGIHERIDIGETEKHTTVGQANSPFNGQVSHVLVPPTVLKKPIAPVKQIDDKVRLTLMKDKRY
jgi:hypothetical protein